MATMRHARFDVASLAIEGVNVPVKASYLLVAERPGSEQLDWECLAFAFDDAPIAEGRYPVAIVTLDGRNLTGPAVLVRSVEGTHVLRGDGPLDGLLPTDLG